jgi:hypothetical protein
MTGCTVGVGALVTLGTEQGPMDVSDDDSRSNGVTLQRNNNNDKI